MTIEGLVRLNGKEIEDKSKKLLTHFQKDYFEKVQATPLLKIVDFLKETHDIKFDFSSILGFNINNYRILGACNPIKRIILIDSSLKNDQAKFNFTLAHELGHLALHRAIKIKYDEKDEEQDNKLSFDDFIKGHRLKTDRDWMEWQANFYASSLLMPCDIFISALIYFQKQIGISRTGKIFIDNQICNEQSFYQLINLLSLEFKVSKSAVEYRLKKLNLIDDNRTTFHTIYY